MKLRMNDNPYKGKLLTFCGLDGCGKTTQINRLINLFSQLNYDVFLTKQPTDAVRKSEIFRNYMDNPDHTGFDYRSLSLLAASDRLQHSNEVIAKELEQGKTVLCDRYFYSCLANLRARGYTKDQWIYEISEYIIKPDFAFFFDVDVDTAVNRVRSRETEKDRYIDMDLQHKLRFEYLQIAKENGGIILPTDCDENDTFNSIKSFILEQKMGEVS